MFYIYIDIKGQNEYKLEEFNVTNSVGRESSMNNHLISTWLLLQSCVEHKKKLTLEMAWFSTVGSWHSDRPPSSEDTVEEARQISVKADKERNRGTDYEEVLETADVLQSHDSNQVVSSAHSLPDGLMSFHSKRVASDIFLCLMIRFKTRQRGD